MKRVLLFPALLALTLGISTIASASDSVSITFADGEQVSDGITLTNIDPMGDGPVVIDGDALITVQNQFSKSRYVYFKVDDDFVMDLPDGTTLKLSADVLDSAKIPLVVQYDSNLASAPVEGAYTDSKPQRVTGTGKQVTLNWELPRARFANRQNGGADFRITFSGTDITFKRITLTK